MRNSKSSRRKPQILRKKWPPGKVSAREENTKKNSSSGKMVKIKMESHSFLNRKETKRETVMRLNKTLTMKNGREQTPLTTTMLMTIGSKTTTTICLLLIGSMEKSRKMTPVGSKVLKTVADVAKEVRKVKARNLHVKMAADLHAPMALFSTEKV